MTVLLKGIMNEGYRPERHLWDSQQNRNLGNS